MSWGPLLRLIFQVDFQDVDTFLRLLALLAEWLNAGLRTEPWRIVTRRGLMLELEVACLPIDRRNGLSRLRRALYVLTGDVSFGGRQHLHDERVCIGGQNFRLHLADVLLGSILTLGRDLDLTGKEVGATFFVQIFCRLNFLQGFR